MAGLMTAPMIVEPSSSLKNPSLGGRNFDRTDRKRLFARSLSMARRASHLLQPRRRLIVDGRLQS
jgi:hypothetical protein